ncbi:MAG: hypothetical protein ABW139_00870 [Candidatus Thiodiazotropha sp. DIVDIV]
MWNERAKAVAADHPCLAGHFPGNPIVPGTLILERVIELLAQRHPEQRVSEIVNVKFMQPLMPGQSFELSAEEKGNLINFECLVEEITIVTGKLTLTKTGS